MQSIKVFCALWSSLFSPFNFPKMSAKKQINVFVSLISKFETLLCHFQIRTPCRRVLQTSQDSFLWITIAPECAELVSHNPGPYPDKTLNSIWVLRGRFYEVDHFDDAFHNLVKFRTRDSSYQILSMHHTVNSNHIRIVIFQKFQDTVPTARHCGSAICCGRQCLKSEFLFTKMVLDHSVKSSQLWWF